MSPEYLMIYVGLMIVSFMLLSGIARVMQLKHSSSINRRWKRILWLLSCLLFVPIFVALIKMPMFIWNEMRDFIAAEDGKNHRNQKGDLK